MNKKIATLLTVRELNVFKRLDTPRKIQDFLETLNSNFEKRGETCMSPRRVLRERKAQCIEAAMLAATALWLHGKRPLLLDLKSAENDYDHVVMLFRGPSGLWGAISKSNHAVLRYRDPVYRTVRELAMSYFHEYFTDDGTKNMRSYSQPFSLAQFGTDWIVDEEDVWQIPNALDDSPHVSILISAQSRQLRPADPIERKAGKLIKERKG